MKLIAYPLAALLAFFGIMFVVSGAKGQPLQIVVGVILLVSGAALLWFAYQLPKPSITTIVQKIDLSGDVNLADMKCRSCGGSLGKESVTVKAGAVFVNCQYCGATYQIEEEPKW
jgi:Zn finger protein HypA/HybF involved in hydrogenase expression